MDLLALADFNLVAAHGGFGKASRVSGRPKTTLSRRVMALEEALGVRLLDRGSRALKLTTEGMSLFARTDGLLREIDEAGAVVAGGRDHARGPLRVSAPVLLAHVALGRIAASFARAHPEVQLEITAEDRAVDPVEEGYDVVIRVNPVPDERLVGRCFLHDALVVVAPAAAIRPSPAAGGEPTPVPAVALGTAARDRLWLVSHGGRVERLRPEPVLRLSSLLMVRDAVLAGAGAGLLPRFIVASDIEAGRLSVWGAVEERTAVWALHPSRRLVTGKVTAFLRCLVDAFPRRSW